jgi:hypothetical protein
MNFAWIVIQNMLQNDAARSHHKHDQIDMIIGATFETNEQNIFATFSIGLHFLL